MDGDAPISSLISSISPEMKANFKGETEGRYRLSHSEPAAYRARWTVESCQHTVAGRFDDPATGRSRQKKLPIPKMGTSIFSKGTISLRKCRKGASTERIKPPAPQGLRAGERVKLASYPLRRRPLCVRAASPEGGDHDRIQCRAFQSEGGT
jgi:hypothetical protein